MKLLYWNISELNKNLWKLNTTWNTLQWILLVWRYRWQKAAITRLTTKKGVGGPTLSQPLIQLNCDISQLINGTRARWSVSFISWSRLFFSQWSCQSHHHCSARVCVCMCDDVLQAWYVCMCVSMGESRHRAPHTFWLRGFMLNR